MKLSINITPEDLVQITQVSRCTPLATNHAVARAALRLGLTQMASDTKVAIEQLVAQQVRKAS